MNERINFLKFFYDSGKYAEEPVPAQIVDLFPALVFIYDVEAKKVIFGNRKFSSYFGYNSYDLKDQDDLLPVLVHRDDWDRFEQEMNRFINFNEDETLTVDCRLSSAGNGTESFKVTGNVLKRSYNGKATSILFICQNRGDEAGQATAVMFHDTEEMLQFGSWTILPDKQLVEWTPGFSLILGYDKSSKVRPISVLVEHICDFDRKHFEESLANALTSPSDFSIEYSIRTQTREEKTLCTRAKVITNSRGSVDRVIGITSDVTELRKFERQQERAIRELNRSNQELEEFAYVASHDMQEPLRKISMFGERLHTKLKGKLDDESENYLNRILASANSMKSLIDHLLEFSRTNRKTPDFGRCDLGDLLIQVLSALELKIEESRARIEFEGKLPVIDASTSDLSQLFVNLLSNAIKFRQQGQSPVIKLTVKKVSAAEKARLKLRPDRVFFRFEVQDNGIGFEQEYADKIFLIFQRLNGKSEYPGSGIGLAICKKIVDNHNGMIFAASEPGKGATFTVILPEKQF